MDYKNNISFLRTRQASEGTYIGSVRLFPMIRQSFLSDICNLRGGRCKEKPESQFAAKRRKGVRWEMRLHNLDIPLSREGGFQKIGYPF